MSDTLTYEGLLPFDPAIALGRVSGAAAAIETAPVGYRWVSKRWRVLPDGTRDYAAYHGKTAFKDLLPVSSRLRSHKR